MTPTPVAFLGLSRPLRLAATIMAITALVGCSSGPGRHPGDGGDGGIDATLDATTVDGAAVPDTPAGRAVVWILGVLNTGLTEQDLTGRFSPAFLAQVPPATLVAVLNEGADMKPWVLVGFEGATSATALTAVMKGSSQYWRVQITTDAAGQIIGLLLSPAGDLDPALRSWDAVDTAAAALAPRVNLLAATVAAEDCTPIHSLGADSSLAIGSTFKLWVLAALAADIGAGRHAWTDTIAIEDAHKSLPSGTLQNQPVGTRLSLSAFATQMISISDNTAADHLLAFLGRDAVEAILPLTGHHAPQENQPFLTTRELFTLKLMLPMEDQLSYVQSSTADKRALLGQYDAIYDPRKYQGPPWTAPRAIETLEWFGSPRDLCHVMRALRDYGERPATQPVRQILSTNPGLPDSLGQFSYVGFKGGSEVGVLNLTWLLRRKADQQWMFLTLGFNDSVKPIDEVGASYVALAARSLMAEMLGR